MSFNPPQKKYILENFDLFSVLFDNPTYKEGSKEIKKAFHKKSKKYHPDKCPSNMSEIQKKEYSFQFMLVHFAYKILQDPLKREHYLDVFYPCPEKEKDKRKKEIDQDCTKQKSFKQLQENFSTQKFNQMFEQYKNEQDDIIEYDQSVLTKKQSTKTILDYQQLPRFTSRNIFAEENLTRSGQVTSTDINTMFEYIHSLKDETYSPENVVEYNQDHYQSGGQYTYLAIKQETQNDNPEKKSNYDTDLTAINALNERSISIHNPYQTTGPRIVKKLDDIYGKDMNELVLDKTKYNTIKDRPKKQYGSVQDKFNQTKQQRNHNTPLNEKDRDDYIQKMKTIQQEEKAKRILYMRDKWKM